MFHVVLHEPEIAPNVGNIIRLCANAGCTLHLIKPLGFELDDKRMRRAGLDYHERTSMRVHPNWAAFLADMHPIQGRIFALTSGGQYPPSSVQFQPNDILLFGSESKGLPATLKATIEDHRRIRLPMLPENRSLNLSNAVAITVYEAWRQNEFRGATPMGAPDKPSNT